MNLTNLRALARKNVTAATTTVLDNDDQLLIFNNGILEITRETKCLPTYAQFDTVAEQMEYDLSTLITDYLCPLDEDLMNVYYYDASEYDELDIVTIGYLNSEWSEWQTADSGEPERCVILGDTLYLHPKPDSAITNGVKFYYCKKPAEMDDTNVYPWGGTVELPRLSPYQTVILDYWAKEAYKVLDINDPNSTRRSRAENEYIGKIAWMKAKIKEDAGMMILRSKKAQLQLPSSYSENPF